MITLPLNIISIRRDGGTQARVGNNEETVEQYAEAMRDGRWQWNAENEVVIFRDDAGQQWLADGFHRVEAAQRAGWNEVQARLITGTRRDAVLYAAGANASHGLRRTRADVRRAIEVLLRDEEWVKWSDREIAKHARCDHKTVASVRSELNAGGEIPHVNTRTGSDGKVYTQDVPPARPVAALPVDKVLTSAHVEAMRYHEGMQSNEEAQATITSPPMAVHYSSATPEWYTPAHIIEKVVTLFGHIDLDPCSNAHGEAANVPARFHYTRDDDGLAQSWRVAPWADAAGDVSNAVRVYMNPPYGDEIGPWVRRLVDAHTTGEITEAVALLPARVDTAWFATLRAYPTCFVDGRLKFSGAASGAPFPSAIVYLGSDIDGFRDVFESIGRLYLPAPTPVEVPAPDPATPIRQELEALTNRQAAGMFDEADRASLVAHDAALVRLSATLSDDTYRELAQQLSILRAWEPPLSDDEAFDLSRLGAWERHTARGRTSSERISAHGLTLITMAMMSGEHWGEVVEERTPGGWRIELAQLRAREAARTPAPVAPDAPVAPKVVPPTARTPDDLYAQAEKRLSDLFRQANPDFLRLLALGQDIDLTDDDTDETAQEALWESLTDMLRQYTPEMWAWGLRLTKTARRAA